MRLQVQASSSLQKFEASVTAGKGRQVNRGLVVVSLSG